MCFVNKNEMKLSFSIHLNVFSYFSYESMKSLCEKYNRAIDSLLQLVGDRKFRGSGVAHNS